MSLYQSKSITIDKDFDGSAFLKIDLHNRAINLITRNFIQELDEALTFLERLTGLPALILRSGKSNGFMAGADLQEFLDIQSAQQAEEISSQGQTLFNRLANLPFPTIAVISGPCLGGGLELALACDYRLVYDAPTTQLGLPEVQLGLLPAWGGTQRLPKIVGLERAIQMILGQKRLSAIEAYRWKLADEVAHGEKGLRQQFTSLLGKAISRGKVLRNNLPRITWRQRFLETNPIGLRIIFRGTERMLRLKVPDEMPAPLEALEAIKVGIKKGPVAGLNQECNAAGRLAVSPACRNLIHLFFQGEAAQHLPDEYTGSEFPSIRNVGIVGEGASVAGLAQLVAFKGCSVLIQGANALALGSTMLGIKSLFDQAVKRKLITNQEADRRIALVRGTLDWEGFKEVDLIIDTKSDASRNQGEFFRLLEQFSSPDSILACHSSFAKITDLQKALQNPERVIGFHYFDPFHKIPLVEVATSRQTSRKTISQTLQWTISLGKTPILVQDQPGLVLNRIMYPYLQEAVLLVQDGLKIREIDALMKRFGMPMGPLEYLDELGLAEVINGIEIMKDQLDPVVAKVDGLTLMKENGWLGSKSGKGFYSHPGRTPYPNPLAENLLRASQPRSTKSALPKIARLNEARERMVLMIVNETIKMLSKGSLPDPTKLDLLMVLGSGWAPHRGGPLNYAKDRGTASILQSLQDLQTRHGERFEAAPGFAQWVEQT